ncbi:hypothetical protein PFISCL1PPCAC_25262, partial [Pristionchus fissidentatus]
IVNGSITQVSAGIHALIQLNKSDKQVSVWCMHLNYKAYGPYIIQNNVMTSSQAMVDNEIHRS